MDIYSKARAELATIDSQIAVLQQRRVALRQFIDLGKTLYGGEQPAPVIVTAPEKAAETAPAADASGATDDRQREPAKPRILAACEAHIAAHGPTRTRDLLAVFDGLGIEVRGADPMNALSVLLSKSGRFDSDRKVGWSLRP